MAAVPAGDELAAEQRRLAGASSVVNTVAGYVDDLVQLPGEQLPDWVTALGVPMGWRIARVEGSVVAPARMAVCGQRPDGRWDGCETITVFRFTGMPAIDVVHNNADCTLRDLGADNIITRVLMAPMPAGVTAVRSSGYFRVGGRWVWAQYSTYMAGSDAGGQGRLIQHTVFAEAGSVQRLSDDIARLSNAVHHAFLATMRDMR